jgi:hypothetical protein
MILVAILSIGGGCWTEPPGGTSILFAFVTNLE